MAMKSGEMPSPWSKPHTGFLAGPSFQTHIISKLSSVSLLHCVFSMWLLFFLSFFLVHNVRTIF